MMFLIMQRNRKNEGKNGFAVSKIMVIGFLLSLLLLLSPLPHGGMAQVSERAEWTSIYFSDSTKSPGSVYEFRKDTRRKTAIFTRDAGRLSSFAFAPWDPDLLYFVSGEGRNILRVSLDNVRVREQLIYTHTTNVKDIAFDSRNNLYFSDITKEVGVDGKIWRLEPDGTAARFYTVKIPAIGNSWAGNFTFSPDNVLFLSSSSPEWDRVLLYRVYMSLQPELVFSFRYRAIAGITFGPDNRLYYADHKTIIFSLPPEITNSPCFSASNWNPGRVDYSDPQQQIQIWDVGFRSEIAPGLTIHSRWVMPYAVRDIRFNQVNSDGLYKEYKDKASKINRTMKNAPFGGGLWFRLDSSNDIPNENVYYYRYRYRLKGTATWNEFDANISISYVKNRPRKPPIFPKFKLGPYDKEDMKLYRFRPQQNELVQELRDLDLLAPGESVEWPKIPFPLERYRAYLDTVAEKLEPGKYEIRVDIYNSSGEHTSPGHAFQIILDIRTDSLAEVTTEATEPANLVEGGFQYDIQIDNRKCIADISPPTIGESRMDTCGFLRYDPAAKGLVRLAWKAWHPSEFGVYRFNIVKGARKIGKLPLPNEDSIELPITDEVSSTDNHGESGNFSQESPTLDLLDGCSEAAYAIDLYVFAKATNGNGYRITKYDAKKILGFALAPR